MHTLKKSFRAAACLFLLAASFAITGCAFGNFGNADMTYSKMDVPEGLNGQDKEQVLRTMGIPDSVTRVRETEYWDYNNKCGYFVLLFGRTIEKDLILELEDGRVSQAFLVDKGRSTGLIASQGAVAP